MENDGFELSELIRTNEEPFTVFIKKKNISSLP